MRHTTRTDRDGARIIVCPYCVRRYRLPEGLIGPGGAEIRCPGCAESFVLRIRAPERPDPGAAAPPQEAFIPPARDPNEPSAAPPATDDEGGDVLVSDFGAEPTPWTIADQIAARLESETGGMLAAAQERGRLFSEFGPALMDAFDAFRRDAGPAADAAAFRAALARHCGITLGGRNPQPTPRA